MKKHITVIITILIILVIMFPIRTQLKDGGTVEYKSLTYKISKVKRLISEEEAEKEGKVQNYDRGIIVELFGFEIYNDVE